MAGELILNPQLGAALQETILAEGLARLWAGARHLPGGRGTARILDLGGASFVVKREARGGMARGVLPNRYLWPAPFRREWAVALKLWSQGLAPEPVAVEFERGAVGFAVFSLSRALLPSTSMAELWRGDTLGAEGLALAGAAVGGLHRAGVIHGDLNAGNLLFCQGPKVLFLDLRHSRVFPAAPPAQLRRANLARLGRSLHKLRAVHGSQALPAAWDPVLQGYAAGWGERESWVDELAADLKRGHPWRRRLVWRRRRISP